MPPSITNDGILTQTLGEVTADLSASFRAAFPPIAGEQLDLSPDSYTGREVAILAEQFTLAQDLLLDLITLLDPQQAQGVFLDYHLSLQASTRSPATSSTIAAIVYGLPGTAVGDKRVRYLPTSSQWRTPVGLVIPANGQAITTLSAVETGPVVALETGTEQWLIVDATDGWDAVESTTDATLGTTVESDGAIRERLSRGAVGLCTSTRPAILRALYGVPGVVSAQVWNNRTLLPNAVGVPAKSIESVVEGGSDDAVALAILRSYNGTAGFAGTTSHEVTDTITLEDGSTVTTTETVRWSRIERIDIVIDITVTVLDSTLLGQDAEDVIQAAVAAWTNALNADIDVYPEAISSQVWDALEPGSVSDVTVLIAEKPNTPGGVPIVLSIRQRARTNPEPQQATVEGTIAGPWNLFSGWTLVLGFDGGAPQVATFDAADFAVISAATPIELAAAINRQVTGGVAGVNEGVLTLTSNTAGASSAVQILATGTPALLVTLGLTAGTTTGSDGDITVSFV